MDQSVSSELSKRCTGPCGKIKPLSEFSPDVSKRDGRRSRCRVCINADARQRWPERAERQAEARRLERAADPEKFREARRRRNRRRAAANEEWRRRDRAANPEKYREQARRYQGKGWGRARLARVRAQVFGHYGTCCACCGSTDDLTIDHTVTDGAAHRAKRFGHRGGLNFYLWLIREGFPDGYQTLCRPCNSSKATGSRCRLDHDLATGFG